MKVLITGASGFLGKRLTSYFSSNYITIGRSNADVICDLANEIPICPNSDLVIHSAGKAHFVPKTNQEKKSFFDVNVDGTRNLLVGIERAPQLPKYFVFISSVAVYGLETGHLITEKAPLLASDPYGKSKIEAEVEIQEWCRRNNIICTIIRLPLLAGENPPGNLGAMIKGITKGYYLNIAGGKARKSIVLAEDVARVIPLVAKIGGIYNLTDGCHPSFRELSNCISQQLKKSKPKNLSLFAAKTIGYIGDILGDKATLNSKKLRKITSDLTFDDTKARKAFNWAPIPVLTGLKLV